MRTLFAVTANRRGQGGRDLSTSLETTRQFGWRKGTGWADRPLSERGWAEILRLRAQDDTGGWQSQDDRGAGSGWHTRVDDAGWQATRSGPAKREHRTPRSTLPISPHPPKLAFLAFLAFLAHLPDRQCRHALPTSLVEQALRYPGAPQLRLPSHRYWQTHSFLRPSFHIQPAARACALGSKMFSLPYGVWFHVDFTNWNSP